jgi:MFS family permease
MFKIKHFSALELKIISISSFIIALRLFGLFLVLPIFSVYALGLMYATPENVGITLGIYGLAAMIMQPVFGYLSDRHGRIKMIIVALTLFIVGSLIAAFANTIYSMGLGRLLQGAGAITSVLMALTTDHTRAEVRTKAMAIIGVMIAVTFILAIVIGPYLETRIGLNGTFGVTAVLGLIAINLTIFLPHHTPGEREHISVHFNNIKLILKNKTIGLINLSIFCLHGILIASFVALPTLLNQTLKLSTQQSWWLYLLSLGLAFVFMLLLITLAEIFKAVKKITVLSILLIMAAEAIFLTNFVNAFWVLLAFTLFFTGFISLEALLPSWLTRIVDHKLKGTALGLYISSQFFGAFVGGLFGGYFANIGDSQLFLYLLVVATLWFLMSGGLKQLPQ